MCQHFSLRFGSLVERLLLVLFGIAACVVALADDPAGSESANQPEFNVVAVVPANDASEVCPDTPLRIKFSSPPVCGTGKIEIVDVSNGSLVAGVDVAEKDRVQSIGGLPNFHVIPILVTGDEAVICLPGQALSYGATFEVRVPRGAFLATDGGVNAELGEDTVWRFSTKTAPPAAGSNWLTVAADGSGDFATVQGAIDFLPAGNDKPVVIFIRRGTYNEIVCFHNKHHLTLVGESRKETVIAYRNNEYFNHDTENPFAPGSDPSEAQVRGRGGIYRRGLFLAHRSSDLTIANLTLRNTTEPGGSQSEAIILNGGPDGRAILTKLDLYSFQDTLQINGQAYVSDCYVEGDVDFLWGTGPCYFDRCYARSLRSRAYYTQIRNPPSNHGYIFNECRFDGAPGITGSVLSRIDPQRFPASEVVLLDCVLTQAVGAVGWQLDKSQVAPDVHFWEFNSRQEDGKPVDMSQRLAIARELKLPADQAIVDNYRDARWVLGGQWTPRLSPVVLTQPSPVTAGVGASASLTVDVAAIPAATYQWRRNGDAIAGADGPTLMIKSITEEDAGSYEVVITNVAGEAISQTAPLSVTAN